MPPLRVLNLSGSHFDMGFQHGIAYADSIRMIAAERLRLCGETEWTGRTLERAAILALAQECLPYHEAYAPELVEEMRGMSAATGLSLPELLIAGGFTDFVDTIYNSGTPPQTHPQHGNECTLWMVGGDKTLDGEGILAQTWDMHASATPHVIMVHGKPDHGLEYFAFTITGCLAMIGMNKAGIAVGINNLLGADGQPGVTWTTVCRKILAQDNLEDALACITGARLAGAHNYMIMDADGNGYNVEAMPTRMQITPLTQTPLVHANACQHETTQRVQRPLDHDWQADSTARVARARQLLAVSSDLTEYDMMAITRNRDDAAYSICSICEPPWAESETCGAVVMRPATGEFWGVWGLPHENSYQAFQLDVAGWQRASKSA